MSHQTPSQIGNYTATRVYATTASTYSC